MPPPPIRYPDQIAVPSAAVSAPKDEVNGTLLSGVGTWILPLAMGVMYGGDYMDFTLQGHGVGVMYRYVSDRHCPEGISRRIVLTVGSCYLLLLMNRPRCATFCKFYKFVRKRSVISPHTRPKSKGRGVGWVWGCRGRGIWSEPRVHPLQSIAKRITGAWTLGPGA